MGNGPNGPHKQIKAIHCITHKNCTYTYNQKRKEYPHAQRPATSRGAIDPSRKQKTPPDPSRPPGRGNREPGKPITIAARPKLYEADRHHTICCKLLSQYPYKQPPIPLPENGIPTSIWYDHP